MRLKPWFELSKAEKEELSRAADEAIREWERERGIVLFDETGVHRSSLSPARPFILGSPRPRMLDGERKIPMRTISVVGLIAGLLVLIVVVAAAIWKEWR